jgi:hypothetical protein
MWVRVFVERSFVVAGDGVVCLAFHRETGIEARGPNERRSLRLVTVLGETPLDTRLPVATEQTSSPTTETGGVEATASHIHRLGGVGDSRARAELGRERTATDAQRGLPLSDGTSNGI